MPKPPNGGCRWQASPARKTRPSCVAVGDQPAGHPEIGGDDLDLKIAQAGAARGSDRPRRSARISTSILVAMKNQRPCFVHRAEQRRHVLIDHPIHDRRFEFVAGGEIGRPEDDGVVLREGGVADHRRADRLAHRAARAVGADQKSALALSRCRRCGDRGISRRQPSALSARTTRIRSRTRLDAGNDWARCAQHLLKKYCGTHCASSE